METAHHDEMIEVFRFEDTKKGSYVRTILRTYEHTIRSFLGFDDIAGMLRLANGFDSV
jgi:hypothetical protein